jgi:HSP20 family molecular chaperone IbpA
MNITNQHRGNKFLSGFANNHVLKDFYMKSDDDKPEGVDVFENENYYRININLPRYSSDELDVYLKENKDLQILAEHKHEEIDTSPIGHTFELPTDIDVSDIEAIFDRGELIIEIPKRS